MPDIPATFEDFLEVTRELSDRINQPPPPTRRVITNTRDADSYHHPDHVGHGLPETELPEPPERKYIPPVQSFPGQSLDPDVPQSFIETEILGNLLLGPKENSEKPAEDLAASYGG